MLVLCKVPTPSLPVLSTAPEAFLQWTALNLLDTVTGQLSQVARVSGSWPMIVWLLGESERPASLSSWDNLHSRVPPWLWAFTWDHTLFGPSLFLSCFPYFLLLSPGSFSLTNHLHVNPHLSVSSEEANLRHILAQGYIHWHTSGHTNYGYAPKMWLRNPYYPLPTSLGSEHTQGTMNLTS